MAKNKDKKIYLVIVISVLVIGVVLFMCLGKKDYEDKKQDETVSVNSIESIDLGNGLIITQTGSYSGIYMEDGSDVYVEDVMYIVLKNESELPLQYVDIYMEYSDGMAQFSASTIPEGASVLVLEKNRLAGRTEIGNIKSDNVIFFDENLDKCEDLFKLDVLDGAFNITNIGNKNIFGIIYVYYKNVDNGYYKGGITYRAKIEDGLDMGDIKQVMTNHISADNSEIMMITYAE